MFQGLGCSPIKAVRELGSERRETVRSISGVGVRALRGPFPSTRGPGRTHPWCTSYRAHVSPPQDECSPIPTSPEPPVAQPRQRWVLCPCGDGAKEVLRIQEKVTARRAGTPGNRSSGDWVGPVAQRIRARGYEPRCRGFESLLAHNRPKREFPFPLG
ncbi:hypothetical protein Lal_00044989 [Lupinus albus]|nr:hypothetical protein Lal_00044989 [Lupinus albus]